MVVTVARQPAPDARDTWAASVSVHALVLMVGLVCFKTAKLVGVAAKTKVPIGTGLLAYAQDVAVCMVWLALLVGLGRFVAHRRTLRVLALAGISLAEISMLFYAMFNVHYFTLFGIPLNLEAVSDVEHVGDFWDTIETYLGSWHTAAAGMFSLLIVVAPSLLARERLGRALRLAARPLGAVARGWRAPVVAGSGLSAIVLVPIDRFELAKNDVVEMIQSAARVGLETDEEPENFDEGTNRPPRSFSEPNATIEPSQELRDLRQRVRWANNAKPMNVVFIVLESMVSPDVAEQLGIDEALPFTRKLAKRSIVFEDYSTVFPLSMKSLITLTCSVLPSPQRLTLTKINPQLDCRSVMEVATERGYRAGLFHSGRFSFTLKNLYFEDRGFEVMKDANDLAQANPELATDYWGIQEEATIDAMFDWIDEGSERPFLAVYIPVAGHFPYVPLNESFQDRYGTKTNVRSYKNAMAYTDAMVKRTIKGFRERELVNDTVFVIVGDHGLPLEIHPNNNTQSAEAYEENVRTLGYIYQPKHIKNEISYGEMVQHVDLLPSLYDMLGWEIPERYAGDSIFSSRPKKMAIHYTIRSKELAALRDGDIKVILDRRTGKARAYDLAADPGETEDVSSEHQAFTDFTIDFFDKFIPAHTQYIAEYPARGSLEDLTLLHDRIAAADPPSVPRQQAISLALEAMQPDTEAGYRQAEKLLLSAAKEDPADFEVLLTLVRVYDRVSLLTEAGSYEGSWADKVVTGGDDDEVLARKLHAALRATFSDESAQRRLDATLLWGNYVGPNSSPGMNVSALLAAHAADPEDPEIMALAAQLTNHHRARALILEETDYPLEDALEKLHAYVEAHPNNWFIGRRLFAVYANFLEDPDAAFSLYSKEDALESGNATMLAEVGVAYYHQGRVEDALELLDAATKAATRARLEVAQASYFSMAGAAALMLGDEALARRYFNASWEYDSSQARAAAGLAIMAAWRRDEGQLVHWLERARAHRGRARKWAWTAEAELSCLWRQKTKMRSQYLKAGGGDMIVDESRYHTAMHLEDWAGAERAVRDLVRKNAYEARRFERYAAMAKEIAKHHRHARLPTAPKALHDLQKAYYGERAAWRKVDRAAKAKLTRRARALADAYFEEFPSGVHTGTVERLLDPDAGPPARVKRKRDGDDDDAADDEHAAEGEDEEHDDGG